VRFGGGQLAGWLRKAREYLMANLAGDQLRNSIAQLLRIKFQQVVLEKRLTATTADVFFVDDTNAVFPRPIAIEAKDWKARLTSEDIARIYNLYAPSLSKREIDHLWIIGRNPLSGSPNKSLESLPNVKYSTFDEFRASLMNFTNVLSNNIFLFEHDDASRYFVDTRIRNSSDNLLHHVMAWLDARIVEVCATDKKIRNEIVDAQRSNRHPSHIYTHYFYLKAKEKNPEAYLIARLADSTTFESVLATVVCAANELAWSGNRNLARVILLNSLTSISADHVRRYVEDGDAMQVFRADAEALRALIVARCLSMNESRNKWLISVDALLELASYASRGSFFVTIPGPEKKVRKVEVALDLVSKAVGQELRRHVNRFVTRNSSRSIMSVKPMGPAAEKFGSEPSYRTVEVPGLSKTRGK
jgi:hypothetical protein